MIVIANFISSISENEDVKDMSSTLSLDKKQEFTFSCVTYLDCVISLRVDTVPMYSDPRPFCFTLHKRMKNSDSSEEEI